MYTIGQNCIFCSKHARHQYERLYRLEWNYVKKEIILKNTIFSPSDSREKNGNKKVEFKKIHSYKKCESAREKNWLNVSWTVSCRIRNASFSIIATHISQPKRNEDKSEWVAVFIIIIININ